MIKNIFKTVLLLMIILECSCDEIFEVDISDETLTIYSPVEGITINDSSVTFFWDPLVDATQYHLQVFNPSLVGLVSMPYDTIVEVNNIELDLTNGSYEWRLRGENGYYKTQYIYNVFSIEVN